MKYTAIVTFLFLICTAGYGQIQPPNLYCINGDGLEIEIFWSPPPVQCGPLTGFEIFYATDANGPYSNITINNPAVVDTAFTIVDPNATIYAFMQSTMNCPGQMPVNSDTLIWTLAPPVMKTVSVNSTGQVEVTWYQSESPDVAAYLVYTDGGNIPDTAYGNGTTTYVDPISDPGAMSHNYKIAWWRGCGVDGDRRGSIGLPYNSIFAQNLQQDRCNRLFTFSWSSYQNYTEGVLGYEIEVSENGNPFTAIDTVPNSQQIYSYNNAIADVFYCFRISAVLPNGCKASSNEICDSARVVAIPSGAQIRNATVLDDNSVIIEYYPDTSGDIELVFAERSLTGDNFDGWPTSLEGTAGNPEYEIYRDGAAPTQSNDFYYRFVREDECDNQHVTDTVKTILLDAGIGSGFSGELEWTAYMNTNGVVTGYSIIKIVNGVSSELVSLGPGILSYVDLNALSTQTLDTVCYQIVAEIDLDILSIPGVVNDVIFSESNIVCLKPTPRVIFPSAFRPEGFNIIFMPIISFGTSVNYNFRIYDRYDRKLFETNDPNVGWDGTDGDDIAPMNNYVYYLIFQGQDGVLYEDAGNVLLLR